MRGTLSMARAVTFFAASRCNNSGFCAGQIKLIRQVPSCIRSTSSTPSSGCFSGARTLRTISEADHSAFASATISTPASRYSSSEKFAATPAPVSTITSKPSFLRRSATSGVVATRFSPAWISLGMPIFIFSLPLQRNIKGLPIREAATPHGILCAKIEFRKQSKHEEEVRMNFTTVCPIVLANDLMQINLRAEGAHLLPRCPRTARVYGHQRPPRMPKTTRMGAVCRLAGTHAPAVLQQRQDQARPHQPTGDACLRSLLLQGTRSTLQSALRKPPALLNRLQQWVIRLYGRVGYHKTLIAIANKHARQLWALLVKGKTYDLNAWQRYCTGKMTPTEARYNQVQPTATCSEAPQVRPTSCDPG